VPFQATSASNGDVAIAIDALVNEHQVDLINLSLGGFQPSQVELDAIQAATEAGALVICSAGNENGGPVTYPAAYAQTIGVSAIGIPGCCPVGGLDAATTPTESDRYSFTGAYSPSFTSVGPAINCVGPGVAIISTVPGTKDGSPPYAAMSGTSMAAPAVCAALAVRLSADQIYRGMPRDIQRAMRAAAVLLRSSRDLGLRAGYQGFGLPS
jgi:subtilisin family serine protease